jgi:sulfhydrogenase subunit beta (sulfur reductase)
MAAPESEKINRFISQEALESWLDRQAAARTLVAPRRVASLLLYRPVAGSREIAWSEAGSARSAPAGRPVLSLKELFLPPSERLLAIERNGAEVHLEETLPEGDVLAFGVRPCDGRGVRLLDALFLEQEPADAYYAHRRANTTLVGLACREMGPNCFCTSVGGAPDDPTGMDMMLFETEAGYLAEAITQKGRRLLDEAGWPESVIAGTAIPEGESFPLPAKEVWRRRFDDEFWSLLGERCLSCRACAYVCPTCRCFDVRDEMLAPGKYERLRCWDACTGENYRRVAGGHKARPGKGERLRNRFYCKFDYYPEQCGLGELPACTGCGRCIEACPAGVDILEVLGEMRRPA